MVFFLYNFPLFPAPFPEWSPLPSPKGYLSGQGQSFLCWAPSAFQPVTFFVPFGLLGRASMALHCVSSAILGGASLALHCVASAILLFSIPFCSLGLLMFFLFTDSLLRCFPAFLFFFLVPPSFTFPGVYAPKVSLRSTSYGVSFGVLAYISCCLSFSVLPLAPKGLLSGQSKVSFARPESIPFGAGAIFLFLCDWLSPLFRKLLAGFLQGV